MNSILENINYSLINYLKKEFLSFFMKNIPILFAEGKSLAKAYESALIELYNKGGRIETQYDKADEPPSIDATMNITILEPWSDPMIHKAFPGGIEDLMEYVMELQGYKDHWMKNMNDSEDTRWEYTYHWRLHDYGSWKESNKIVGHFRINQIEQVIEKLVDSFFTRRAQMITWMPNVDPNYYDPPCLQSLWYRIPEEDNIGYLNCNVRFRSNDAWGASFMNMFGFIHFNKEIIADEISKRTGKEIKLGRMNWHADSYHIYGKNIEEAKQRLFDRLDKTSFEDRIFNFWDPMIQGIYNEAKPKIEEKIKKFDAEH